MKVLHIARPTPSKVIYYFFQLSLLNNIIIVYVIGLVLCKMQKIRGQLGCF